MANRHEARNHHPDLHYVYPESGKHTIGVEQIRSVCESLELSSYSGSAKVVVIEPAEAMTTSAANALLKTLEEPTRASYLLLVSHRPGLLPPTVRSRCQQIGVPIPNETALLQWMGRQEAGADVLQAAAPQRSPLQALAMIAGDAQDSEKTRCIQLAEILERRGNALTLADQWSKGDVDHTLAWLVRMLHGLIRLRFVQHGSKLITESDESSLHNAALALSIRVLFNRLDEAERLRGELSGGINVQLAMRALLLGFIPHKGMT
jgi:DNA polymerase-3 subunit delta'